MVAANVGAVVGNALATWVAATVAAAGSVAAAVVGADVATVALGNVAVEAVEVAVDLGAQAAKNAAPIPPNKTITSLRLKIRPTGASSLSMSISKSPE